MNTAVRSEVVPPAAEPTGGAKNKKKNKRSNQNKASVQEPRLATGIYLPRRTNNTPE